MEFNQLVNDVRERFGSVDITEIQENLAFQFNLEGENGGTFYVEVKDNILSVEPYEYIDRNALFTISVENFMKLINSKLDPVLAYSTGKLKIDGDIGKALQIKNLLKEEKKVDTVKEKKVSTMEEKKVNIMEEKKVDTMEEKNPDIVEKKIEEKKDIKINNKATKGRKTSSK